MEQKTLESYIEKLIMDNFEWQDFSPDNAGNTYDKFKTIFFKSHPYWENWHEEKGEFYIEFKKYGENRKKIFLKFSLLPTKKPRELILVLVDDQLKIINESREEISLSDVWRYHSVLSGKLNQYIKLGLDLASETY